jgi:hypothetical protein
LIKRLKKTEKLTFKKNWNYLIGLGVLFGVIGIGKILSDKEKNALNNCHKEINGLITEIDHRKSRGDYFHYEFQIKDKKYNGTQSTTGFSDKISVGDTVAIEYSCDNPEYSRIKE